MRFLLATTVFLAAVAAAGPGTAQTVAITAADCARLVQYVEAADVAFKPGVDLQGRPVVPADVEESVRIEPPGEFAVPITVDLQKSLGIPVDPNLFQTQNFSVGVVTWEGGRGYFNGQPLQSEQSAKFATLCQKRMANTKPR